MKDQNEQKQENLENKGTKIDYLTEDKPIPGQNFVCMSFVSPEGIRNTTVRALKIRGVFEKYEDAQNYAKKLQEEDPKFNVFVGEVGKWLPWDPNANDKTKVKESQYYEEELQKLIKGYEDNLERTKKAENERRQELLKKALETSKKDKSKSARERLKQKIEEKKAKEALEKSKNNKLEDKQKEEEIKKAEQLATLERERIDKNENVIKKSEENLKSLDENINKLRELQNKLKHKKQQENTN